MVSISACHVEDPGSIPGRGVSVHHSNGDGSDLRGGRGWSEKERKHSRIGVGCSGVVGGGWGWVVGGGGVGGRAGGGGGGGGLGYRRRFLLTREKTMPGRLATLTRRQRLGLSSHRRKITAASEDRTHDLRIMRPTRCQLRYSRLRNVACMRHPPRIRMLAPE